MSGRPAVFLDRDGTLIEEVGYLDAIERIALFPWTLDALRLLRRAGYSLVVVTNQAGVARGYFDEAFVADVHRHLHERFAAAGVAVDGFYFCPHHPEATLPQYRMVCDCRKPRPGLIARAAADLGLDVSRSYVVGDRWLDVGLAQNSGARGILVRTGYGAHESRHPEPDITPEVVVDHLFAAASYIVRANLPPLAPGTTKP